jgi:hypothetical protein
MGTVVRLVGIQFGLPLWVIGDEPSLIFGALKMLELHTLLPALHISEFAHVLYYTPYIPYLYIPTFVGLITIKWLFFAGDFAQFADYLMINVDDFFLIARLYSIIFGVLTIWLVYITTRNIFKKESIANAAALCMSCSFLAVNFSHWARHWTPVTTFFALALYILSHPNWSVSKRYLFLALSVAIGIGINLQVVFVLVLGVLWILVVDRLKVTKILQSTWFWQALAIFLVGSGIAYLIWPNGFGFFGSFKKIIPGGSDTHKNISGLLQAYWFYATNFIKAEPVLLSTFLIGSLILFYRRNKVIIVIWLFIIFYISTFFLVFSTSDRFILVIYPFIAVIAGYGFVIFYEYIFVRNKRIAQVLCVIMVLGLSIPIIRFDYLLYKNDTRVQVIHWIEQQLPMGSKIMVAVPLMRVSPTNEALSALQQIDSNALRTIDKAEQKLPQNFFKSKRFDAINLYTVSSSSIFLNLRDYMKENNFNYLIIDESYAHQRGVNFQPQEVGEVIRIFNGSISSINYGLSPGHETIPDGYGDGLRELFLSPSLGPNIVIVKL